MSCPPHAVDAQCELRSAFLGGFAGQVVSGSIWLAAGIVGVGADPPVAMAVLFLGSAFIFPLA